MPEPCTIVLPCIDLPDGGSTRSLTVAQELIGAIISPQPVSSPSDPCREIARAMQAPIDAPLLFKKAKPGSRVAVIIDDITRPTPTKLLLPPVLEELHNAGIDRKNIAIVLALGSHRPMTKEEIQQKVGAEVAEQYPIINTPAWEREKFCFLGTSRKGIPAWVNQSVATADLRIGLGMISPHLDAGFSGGAKIILPGVCGLETVEAFHAQMAAIKENQLGLDKAALRLDLEDFVAEKVPLAWIVNVVLDHSGAIHSCVAGDPMAAHRVGAKQSLRVYGAGVNKKYPIVIANAHPYGNDFWQATKALAAAEAITAPGGTIILVAPCPEGYAEHPLFPVYANLPQSDLQQIICAGTAEDPIAAGEAAALRRIKSTFSVAVVSENLDHSELSDYDFTPFSSLAEAVDQARKKYQGPQKGVLAVLTHGGMTAPNLKNYAVTL